jgi:predicted nucleic acid-binding protein
VNVVDASVLVEYLGGMKHAEAAGEAIGRERWVWAPALIDAEVGNALRRLTRMKRLSAGRASTALDQLFFMPLQRVPLGALTERAWELRDNVTFYDGLYVAVAEELKAPLLTFDARLAKAKGLKTEVELIAPV